MTRPEMRITTKRASAPRSPSRAVASCWILLLAFAASGTAARTEEPTAPVSVRFELNDAQVKGRGLEGVQVRVVAPGRAGEIASGVTGSDGRWRAHLPRGTYEVSYRLAGYVPHTSGATEIREEGQVVTVSLPRLLEDEIAEAADLAVPADLQPPDGRPEPASTPAPEPSQSKGGLPLPVLVGIVSAVIFALRRARRGRR